MAQFNPLSPEFSPLQRRLRVPRAIRHAPFRRVALRVVCLAVGIAFAPGLTSLRHVAAQAPPAVAPPASLAIAGAVGKPAKWTAAQMATQFAADIRPLDYTLKGAKLSAKQTFPLLKLIDAALPKVNPHVKHGDLQFIVAVEGSDGYTVDFSYAELLPEIGNRPVLVALDQDGKALTGEGGPAELIVPSDVKPARWVHGIARIVVIDGSQVPEPLDAK